MFRGVLDHFRNSFVKLQILPGGKAEAVYEVKGLKDHVKGGRDVFQFRPEDEVPVQPGDLIVVTLSGDRWTVTGVESTVVGDEYLYKSAYVRPATGLPPSPRGSSHTVHVGDSPGAVVSIAGRDAFVVASPQIAPIRDELAGLFEELLTALDADESIGLEEKGDLRTEVDQLKLELTKGKPLAERVMGYLSNIETIASLTVYAHALGELLARVSFGR